MMPPRQHNRAFIFMLVAVAMSLSSAHAEVFDGVTAQWCTQLNQSPDANNTIVLGSSLSISFGLLQCVTNKSVTFLGTSTAATQVSSGSLRLKTSGYVQIQGMCYVTFSSASVTIENAAQLTQTNVQLVSVSFLSAAALTLRNVTHAELASVTVARNRASVAPVALQSCASVIVRDSSFAGNDAGSVGAISAIGVGLLAVADSRFAQNSGGALAHVINASDTQVALARCELVSNGGLLATDRDLVAVSGGSLAMTASQVSLNWGATLALRGLVAASNVTDSSFALNFNPRQRSLIDVDGCAGGLTIARSTISYNLGGGLSVRNCVAGVVQTKLWAQGSFGVACGDQGSINAPSASLYKNGWTINLFGPDKFVDATCMPGCVGLSLFGGVNACTNATTVVKGFNVSCPGGLNKCSQCQESATCIDCNGLPFGTSGVATCDKWNTLKSSGVQVSYDASTSPALSLTAIPQTNDAFTGASMGLGYEAMTVYYFNTSSNAEVALYRFPINGSDYTRTRGNATNDQFCLNYERVLDNGAGLLLQQCLFDVAQSVLFGNQTLTVPHDHIKITVSLSNMVAFDNQTQNLYPDDIDTATRRVAIELSLRMSQAGTMGAVPAGATYLEAKRFVGGDFDMAMELPNYAVFNDDASTFAYSLNSTSSSPSSSSSSSAQYALVLEFTGAFDTVYYDPQFGLLLDSNNGGGGDSILVEVLVPVLVGGALLLVVLFAIGFAAWVVYQKRKTNRAHQHRDMINFSVEGSDQPRSSA